LADREESIHIRIKIDVDAEDKELIQNLSSEIARADEDIVTKKQSRAAVTSKEEETDDEIDDLQKEIKNIQTRLKKGVDPKDPETIKERLEAKRDRLLLKEFKEGPVGIVHDFTQEQAGNLRKFVTNPSTFLIAGLSKILGKYGRAAAKGGVYAIIALLVYETVLFALDQLMAPGRPLDRRFKRIARLETMSFYERVLQEELRHGYQEIRVTTQQGLRGGQSQVNGNLFEFSSGATGIIQSSPYRSSQDIYRSMSADGSVTDRQGNPRRRSVFFSGR
jgi:hypothetical protein